MVDHSKPKALEFESSDSKEIEWKRENKLRKKIEQEKRWVRSTYLFTFVKTWSGTVVTGIVSSKSVRNVQKQKHRKQDLH